MYPIGSAVKKVAFWTVHIKHKQNIMPNDLLQLYLVWQQQLCGLRSLPEVSLTKRLSK